MQTKLLTFAFLFFILVLYRVVNEPLESISVDLGFSGNTLAEGDIELIFCLCSSLMSDSSF